MYGRDKITAPLCTNYNNTYEYNHISDRNYGAHRTNGVMIKMYKMYAIILSENYKRKVHIGDEVID
jgi:hypothetical protein